MKTILSLSFILIVMFSDVAKTSAPEEKELEAVSLGESIGTEIDKTEREYYRLFPDIEGFQSARLIPVSRSKLRLEYSYETALGLQPKSRHVTADAFEMTRLHIKLTDDYHRSLSQRIEDREPEAEMLYRLALKYAAEASYDISSQLLGDLLIEYPDSRQAAVANKFYGDIEQLRRTKKALFFKGSLVDQSGRMNLLIFSGYYGLWLGVATPMALDAESAQAYAAGLLLGGPLSVLLCHELTKDANISDGRATMISLGGHLGTWQGIGWAAVADHEAKQVIGTGELCGLAGIGAATLLTSKASFSEGHAELTSSGLGWGAWFGAVFAALADHDGDDVLRDMLIGSDLLVLGTAIGARDVRMSKTRVRLINLAGVLGTVFGFGIDLLVEVDDASTAFAVAGLGSVGGLVMGAHLTKDYDKGRELSFSTNSSGVGFALNENDMPWGISPRFAFEHRPHDGKGLTSSIGFQITF